MAPTNKCVRAAHFLTFLTLDFLQWQCMERAGVQDEVLDRIRDIQLSMQSGHIQALESGFKSQLHTLSKQLADGKLSDVTDCTAWLFPENAA